MSEIAQYRGTGKRKTSVARVILRPGDGSTWINGRRLEEYFPRESLRVIATAPLRVAGMEGRFDLWARLDGGGIAGQAGALRHGLARALVEADPNLSGAAQARGLPDAGRARGRAQEGRPQEGPEAASVLEALAHCVCGSRMPERGMCLRMVRSVLSGAGNSRLGRPISSCRRAESDPAEYLSAP